MLSERIVRNGKFYGDFSAPWGVDHNFTLHNCVLCTKMMSKRTFLSIQIELFFGIYVEVFSLMYILFWYFLKFIRTIDRALENYYKFIDFIRFKYFRLFRSVAVGLSYRKYFQFWVFWDIFIIMNTKSHSQDGVSCLNCGTFEFFRQRFCVPSSFQLQK